MEEPPQNAHRQPQLRIDNVLSSQPELGPHIPDGGYGWVIFSVSLLFKLFIPSLLVSYGIFIMFLHLENEISELPILWESTYLYAPLLYVVTITICEPFSTSLVTDNRWPKFVAYSGICLVCAGFLIFWFAIHKGIMSGILFVLAGSLSGMGSSIVTVMCDTLITQYFKLKLIAVTGVLRIGTFLGYVFTPILLGRSLAHYGILKGLIWYQVIILQGSVLSMVFKKPKYLKSNSSSKKYNKLIQVSGDDEEDIFSKAATELGCIPSSGNESNPERQAATRSESNQRTNNGTPSSSKTSTIHLADVHNSEQRQDWEAFPDQESTRKDSLTKQHLHFSFANEFKTDLERIENFEDDFVHIPKPIYNDVQINNNTSYSFDEFDAVPSPKSEETIFTMNVQQKSNLRRYFAFLEQPKFYMLLIQHITAKFSTFVFFALYPTFLYSSVSYNIENCSELLGAIATVGLVHTIITMALRSAHTKKREFILGCSCLLGSFGYVMLALLEHEAWLIIGGAGIYISISSLEHLGDPLMKIHLRGESRQTFLFLCLFTGLAFSIFMMMNVTYRYIFIFMAVLQLLSCISWSVNILLRHGSY